MLACLALEAAINGRLSAQGLVLPHGFFAAGAWIGLAAFALHAATRRWSLTVQDGGITARRHSWLWSRADTVPGDASRTLAHKLLYATGSGASEHRYHAVYARGAGDTLVRLTPGLGGEAAATALGQSLAQAWAHRRGRFAAGMQRPARAQYSRPAWGALLVLALVVWWVVGPKVAGMARRTPAAESAAPAVSYSAVDGRLLDAQNAGDATALRAALAAGANPNLLAPNGSSVLMLAAHRGQLEHIEALLAAGAKPDLRQTQKDSELGDTALLRAFYGGNLAAAQRLVLAGAGLSARNRWDWGPVHMAAQSGCIACLEWLAAQGQPLDEPAMASRGRPPPCWPQGGAGWRRCSGSRPGASTWRARTPMARPRWTGRASRNRLKRSSGSWSERAERGSYALRCTCARRYASSRSTRCTISFFMAGGAVRSSFARFCWATSWNWSPPYSQALTSAA